MDFKMHQNVDLKSKTSFAANDAMIETSRYTLSDLHPITRLSQKMSQSLKVSEQFTIQPITEQDSDGVLSFLKEFFFKDEPLNTYINLGECKELEEYSLKCIPEHCSFKAVNEKGEIIGMLLNGLIKKPSPEQKHQKLAENCKHPKFKKILGLMDYIDTQFDIFKLYPDKDVILDAKIISVNSKYRGMGIAGSLIEQTLDYMRANNISVIHVLCSSHFSARVVEKLDFKQVYRLDYCDYKVNDEVVFKPKAPHAAARILVKEI